MNFRGCESAASATSKVKSEARFGLSGPSYLLASVFDAEIGPIEATLDRKRKSTSDLKKPTYIPGRPAGSAAGKKYI